MRTFHYDQMRAWFFAKEVSVFGAPPDVVEAWQDKSKVETLLLRKHVFRKVCSTAARIDVEGELQKFWKSETKRNTSKPLLRRRAAKMAKKHATCRLQLLCLPLANGRSVETSRSLCRRRNRDMTVPEIEKSLQNTGSEVQPSLAEAGKQGPSNLSSNSILGIDLKEDDDDDNARERRGRHDFQKQRVLETAARKMNDSDSRKQRKK